MVTNYEVDAFLTSLRDEEPEVQAIIRNILKVLDDAHNPNLAGARKRLGALMQRDAEIGKYQRVWTVVAPWLKETSEPAQPGKPKTKVIEELGVAPP